MFLIYYRFIVYKYFMFIFYEGVILFFWERSWLFNAIVEIWNRTLMRNPFSLLSIPYQSHNVLRFVNNKATWSLLGIYASKTHHNKCMCMCVCQLFVCLLDLLVVYIPEVIPKIPRILEPFGIHFFIFKYIFAIV